MSTESRAKLILDLLTSVAVVVLAAIAIWTVAIPRLQGGAKPSSIVSVSDVVTSPGNHVVGRSSKVFIIEYSDFQCPFCGRHARETYPRIKTALIDQGAVRYAFKHLPLDNHKHARGSSEAAECAGNQGQFWLWHEVMFANQKLLAPDDLLKHASAMGLDMGAFVGCLSSEAIKATIDADRAEAKRLGITGTPAFLVGTADDTDRIIDVKLRIGGAQPFEIFEEAVSRVAKSF